MIRPLDEYTTPIESGLAPTSGGRLSPAREAKLLHDLSELQRARQRAWVDAREFVVARFVPSAAVVDWPRPVEDVHLPEETQ